MSVDEAVGFLRRDARDRSETIYYTYVVDSEERLLGVVSFRDLLVAARDRTVGEVMHTEVITAPQSADRGSLEELFMRCNLQSISLVDAQRRIKSVVTRDALVTFQASR